MRRLLPPQTPLSSGEYDVEQANDPGRRLWL
jgi:hypothetical protein